MPLLKFVYGFPCSIRRNIFALPCKKTLYYVYYVNHSHIIYPLRNKTTNGQRIALNLSTKTYGTRLWSKRYWVLLEVITLILPHTLTWNPYVAHVFIYLYPSLCARPPSTRTQYHHFFHSAILDRHSNGVMDLSFYTTFTFWVHTPNMSDAIEKVVMIVEALRHQHRPPLTMMITNVPSTCQCTCIHSMPT